MNMPQPSGDGDTVAIVAQLVGGGDVPFAQLSWFETALFLFSLEPRHSFLHECTPSLNVVVAVHAGAERRLRRREVPDR